MHRRTKSSHHILPSKPDEERSRWISHSASYLIDVVLSKMASYSAGRWTQNPTLLCEIRAQRMLCGALVPEVAQVLAIRHTVIGSRSRSADGTARSTFSCRQLPCHSAEQAKTGELSIRVTLCGRIRLLKSFDWACWAYVARHLKIRWTSLILLRLIYPNLRCFCTIYSVSQSFQGLEVERRRLLIESYAAPIANDSRCDFYIRSKFRAAPI